MPLVLEDKSNYLAGQFVSIVFPGLTHVRPLSGDTHKTSVWALPKSGEDRAYPTIQKGISPSISSSSETSLGKLSAGVSPRVGRCAQPPQIPLTCLLAHKPWQRLHQLCQLDPLRLRD